MIDILKKDMVHHLSGSHYQKKVRITFQLFLRAFLSIEFKAVFWYRIYHITDKKGLSLLTFLLYQRSKRKYSIDIAPKATIGPGFRIAHCSDIVIGPNAIIGRDVVIFNGVTLGKRYPSAKDGMPKIGDCCTLGTGCKILGAVTLGNHVKIGANSVVLINVPPNSSAVGAPAKVLRMRAD